MSEPLSGRCFCGEVRYRCGPLLYPATLCHCESCRRAAGAAAVGWLTVATAHFAWTHGEAREYESSPGVFRSFCPRCGTPLTYRATARGGEIDATLGSLEAPAAVAPADHIWMADAPAWDRPNDGLPCFPGSRGRP